MSPPDRETETSSLLNPPTRIVVAFGPPSLNNNNNNDEGDGTVIDPGVNEPSTVLLRHDSDFSVGTAYHDGSPNDPVDGGMLGHGAVGPAG